MCGRCYSGSEVSKNDFEDMCVSQGADQNNTKGRRSDCFTTK